MKNIITNVDNYYKLCIAESNSIKDVFNKVISFLNERNIMDEIYKQIDGVYNSFDLAKTIANITITELSKDNEFKKLSDDKKEQFNNSLLENFWFNPFDYAGHKKIFIDCFILEYMSLYFDLKGSLDNIYAFKNSKDEICSQMNEMYFDFIVDNIENSMKNVFQKVFESGYTFYANKFYYGLISEIGTKIQEIVINELSKAYSELIDAIYN